MSLKTQNISNKSIINYCHSQYQSSSFLSLPDEIITEIAAKIPLKNLNNLALTCKRLYTITNHPQFYQKLIRIYFDTIPQSLHEKNPKQFFFDAFHFTQSLEKGSFAIHATRLPQMKCVFEWVHMTKGGIAIGESKMPNTLFPKIVLFDSQSKKATELKTEESEAMVSFCKELSGEEIIICVEVFSKKTFKKFDIKNRTFSSLETIDCEKLKENREPVFHLSLGSVQMDLEQDSFAIYKKNVPHLPPSKIDIASLNTSCCDWITARFETPNKLQVLSRKAIWTLVPLTHFDILNLVNQQYKEIQMLLKAIKSLTSKKIRNEIEQNILAYEYEKEPISHTEFSVNFYDANSPKKLEIIHYFTKGKLQQIIETYGLKNSLLTGFSKTKKTYSEFDYIPVVRNIYPILFKHLNNLPKNVLHEVFKEDYLSLPLKKRVKRIDEYILQQNHRTQTFFLHSAPYEKELIDQLIKENLASKGKATNAPKLLKLLNQKLLMKILEHKRVVAIPA